MRPYVLAVMIVLACQHSDATAQTLGQVQAPHPLISAVTADIRAAKNEIEKLSDIAIECAPPTEPEHKMMLEFDRKCSNARKRWELAYFRAGSADSQRVGTREIDSQLTYMGFALATFMTSYERRLAAMRAFIAASQTGPDSRIRSAAASVRKANESFLSMQREIHQYAQNLSIAISAARQE